MLLCRSAPRARPANEARGAGGRQVEQLTSFVPHPRPTDRYRVPSPRLRDCVRTPALRPHLAAGRPAWERERTETEEALHAARDDHRSGFRARFRLPLAAPLGHTRVMRRGGDDAPQPSARLAVAVSERGGDWPWPAEAKTAGGNSSWRRSAAFTLPLFGLAPCPACS